MIIHEHNQIAHCDDNDGFYRTTFQAELRAKIGGGLRGLFGDMTTAALPDHLVELAGRIDAKRGLGPTEA